MYFKDESGWKHHTGEGVIKPDPKNMFYSEFLLVNAFCDFGAWTIYECDPYL